MILRFATADIINNTEKMGFLMGAPFFSFVLFGKNV